MRSKRGQSASGAAILVIVIAVLILLYIIILSPEDRAALLGEGPGKGSGGPSAGQGQPSANDRNVRQGFQNAPSGQVILQQAIGRLYPEGSNLMEHPIPSFTIFTKTNAKALRRAEHAYIKNSFLGKTKYNLSFTYDKNTMHNPLLSFTAEEYDGILRIYLNGEAIYEREIKSPTPPPITLPEEYLRLNNELIFEANNAGVAFWRIHEFSLQNIMITADVKDIQASTAEHHFTMPPAEYEHLAYLELNYVPNCDPRVTGRLILRVNNKPLSSSYPDCGQMAALQISQNLLQPGDNSLFFLSEQSTYLIDQVSLRSQLSGSMNPTYYFNLPMDVYNALGGQPGGYAGSPQQGGQQGYGGQGGTPGGYGQQQQYGGSASLVITVRFADATQQKVVTLNVNGFQNTIETTDLSYSTLVPPEFLIDGPNSIQLIPQGSPLDVVELRVEIQQAA
ncbi:MAG TPA: hypothetical protein VJG90_04615 [Candidatus Nanoarchaeia archaeon]|nr:hypothetical protein [Candidatus Nanoarchaeia archaeon]